MELGDCLKSVDEVFDSFNSFADVADYVSYNGRKPEFWKFLTDENFVRYSYIQIHYVHKIDFEGLFESWFENIDMDDIFNLQLFKGFMVNVVVESFPFDIAANLATEVDLTEGELNFSEGIYV